MPKTYAAGDEVSAADINQIVKVTGVYATDAGGDDTYAITVSPVPTTYADGDEYTFKPATANTGACTLNVNSLGAKSIKKFDSVSGSKVELLTADIVANQPCRVKYDGTDFILMSGQPRPLYATGITSRAAASGTGTQDIAHGLGVVPRLIRITYSGTTTTNVASVQGTGTATSTSDENCTWTRINDNAEVSGQTAGQIIHTEASGAATGWEATLSALDATNITLNFGTFFAGGTIYIQWEAFA